MRHLKGFSAPQKNTVVWTHVLLYGFWWFWWHFVTHVTIQEFHRQSNFLKFVLLLLCVLQYQSGHEWILKAQSEQHKGHCWLPPNDRTNVWIRRWYVRPRSSCGVFHVWEPQECTVTGQSRVCARARCCWALLLLCAEQFLIYCVLPSLKNLNVRPQQHSDLSPVGVSGGE